MHKIPSSARFIIAGEKCINKRLSKHVTSALKLCYSQIVESMITKKDIISVGPKPFG